MCKRKDFIRADILLFMPLHFKDLVKKRKIYFVSQGKTLDTKLKTYGKYYHHLEKHVAQQVTGPLTIGGKELTHYLEEPEHLYELTDFLVGLLPYSKETIYAHVWADMVLLEPYYPRPDEDVLENMAGTLRIDISGWVSELSYCEKAMNGPQQEKHLWSVLWVMQRSLLLALPNNLNGTGHMLILRTIKKKKKELNTC